MPQAKIVKRYANRKLYDTARSCYITLGDLARMIQDGDEVRVVDNTTGEDLSAVTLAQIIFEAEKRQSSLSLALLRDLVRDGGRAVGGLASEVRHTAQKLRDDLEGRIDRVIGRGDTGDGGQPADLIARVRHSFDQLQAVVGQRLRGAAAGSEPPLGEDMEDIRRRLAALEARIERMSGRL